MQRFLFGVILGLVVITVTLTSVSLFRGGSEGASAAGPTPTKIANDGNLGGVADILVGNLANNIALFWCISKTDHATSNNEIKTALQCNIDVPGQGETGDTPPNWCDVAFACNPSLDEPDLTPGAGLPPYTSFPPAKGFGFYYPDGNLAPAEANCAGQPCTYTVSCFQDVGPPAGLGPNIMWAATILNPKTPLDDFAYAASPAVLPGHSGWAAGTADGVTIGFVDIWYNVNNARCKSLEVPTRTPNFNNAALFAIAVSGKSGANENPNPAPWRQVAADRAPFGCGNGLTCTPTVLNWDGDGCTDEEELNKQTVEKCGDDPLNPSDSWTDTANVDLSGTYDMSWQVVRGDCTDDSTRANCIASAVPGFYFSCIADLQHNTGDNTIAFRPYCYIDSPAIQINPEAYPGAFGDGFPGAPPPGPQVGVYPSGFPNWAFGDIDASHTELNGTFNKITNELSLSGCFLDEDGFGGTGNTYVEFTVSAHQLPSELSIWSFQTPENCLAGTPPGGPGTSPISLTNLNPDKGEARDRDQDGVPDANELQDSCLRDPSNPFDYYDVSVPRDGIIDLPNDIIPVIQHYAPGGYVSGSPDILGGNPDATTWDNFDRAPFWSRGAPDGVINSTDLIGVILQANPGGAPPGGGCGGPLPPFVSPTAGGEMELSVTSGAVSCPEGKDPSHVCVPADASFTMTVEAVEIPAGGYSLAQSWLDYGNDLVFKSSETTWPDCSVDDLGGAKGSSHVSRGCLTGIFSLPASFHTGSLVDFNFNCSSGFSMTEVKLLALDTNPAGSGGALFVEGGTNAPFVPAVNNVFINCGVEPLESVSTTVDATGGGSLSTDTGEVPDAVEVDLNWPPGALPPGTNLTIDVFDSAELEAPTGDGVLMSRAYVFETDGPELATPAVLTISYHPSEFTGTDESTFNVLVYNSEAEDWEIAEVIARDTSDPEFHTITILMPHFSERIICRDGDDCDEDGCTDEQEEGPDERLGGLRDMLNKNDFYDVLGGGGGPPDRIIDLPNDILGVIQHYAPLGTEPTYDVQFDRGPRLTGPPWNMTAPDGVIDLPNDILGVIQQFNHNCQTP